MTAIFKREFRAYFHSFIGCLFISAILFITGIYVTVYNLLSGYPNVSYALSGIIFIFIISVPILTMRILAEEKRQKTDQLILTAPVSVGRIVMGKFIALGAVFTIPVLIISLYPLVLSSFGSVPLLESYAAVLAFYLYGLTCIAIGIFVSSLTESQVIAAVITFAVLFLGYVMTGICNMISATGNWLTRLLSAFNLVSRFDNLVAGTFEIKSILYYLSIIAVALFLTVQSIQKRRYSVSVKKIKMGAYSTAAVVIAVAAAAVINLLAGEVPAKYTTFDVTANKLYSLTEDTKTLLDGLEDTINIYVLSSESAQDTTVEKTLEQYEALSDSITVTYVDPMVNPKFHTKYTDAEITRNSLIVESDKRSKVLDYTTLYETNIDYTTYSQVVTGYDAEGQITSAIDYVTSDDMPKIYFIEGHGELALETDFNAAIEKANVDYESINLLQYDIVPEDAECVVIHAPTSDFSEDDTEKILNYLKNGGDALIVTTWTTEDMSNFQKILNYYEITAADGMVIEEDANGYYQSPFHILPTIEYDTVTDAVSDSYIFAPYAQGLLLPEETGDDLELIPLLSTSAQSYAKADVNNAEDYSKQENDAAGPFTLGVRAVKTIDDDISSTAIIYSSESLFTDSADMMVSGANMTLFSSSLSLLVSEVASAIAVPVKSYDVSYLTISQSNIVMMGMTITIIIPLLILMGGFVIWFRRRKA